MLKDVIGFVASLVLLTAAGDQFVVGVARIARAVRVRPTVVGAVVGGIGTSIPELIVTILASARGETSLALGNLVGSIIANISLGLGIAALVAPIRVDSRTVRREAPISVAAVVLFAALAWRGLSRPEGVVTAAALGAALVGLLVNAQLGPERDELAVEVQDFFELPKRQVGAAEVVRTLLGMAFMLAGAELLVRSAVDLAARLGLAQGFVGLTFVAVGTSSPLVAAGIQAARRGDHDLVVGNLLGGNLVIGLGGAVTLAFLRHGPSGAIELAPLLLMAAIALVSWGFMARRSVVTRWEAALLLVSYAAMLPFVTH